MTPPVPHLYPDFPTLEGFKPLLPMLVAGVPGVPGYNAFLYFRRLFPGQVHGLVPSHSDLPSGTDVTTIAPSGLIRLNPEDPAAVAALFAAQKYRSVIDATGWCALKAAELDPNLARRLNLDVGMHLMQAAQRHGARLIRLSSDLVFSGEARLGSDGPATLGWYREDEPVSPVTVYGKVMAEAETQILAAAPETVVLRVSLPMGPSANDHAGAVDWIDSRFRRKLPATLYYDEIRTPLYVQDLNAVLAQLLRNPSVSGILHVGGPRAMSLNQIAQVVNVAGGYAPELLMGCLRHAAGPMPPRAGDVTMNGQRLAALLPPGLINPWPLDPDLVPQGLTWHATCRAETGNDRGVGDGAGNDNGEPKNPETMARRLYGYGWHGAGEAPWDHPLRLLAEWRAGLA